MATTKSFKIGECAVGGIIQVIINGKVLQINALDYNTKKVVSTGSVMTDEPSCSHKVEDYLLDLTTCYHTGKILEWIKSKIR